ncbi:nicotinate phosphoribosyltransferase [Paenibacillus pasadenensis]|uniref:nicotinate phosphoribosyltransferase n=1 Tax=Paenibacillus pasadenensis TaxID=217090 RepID=UPI00203FC4ED|nr:nicotinate phosphoribosyltransferase [Paenibacillus pasadenensis]MCM3748396.1 nicotinate phosphoribosyltransferase [Paenibacillus pasadenensis]
MEPSIALHTDKYQINMMYAHWKMGTHNRKAVFEMYFRKLPFGSGYAVFAGLQRIVDYITELRFTDTELAYLQQQEERYEPAFIEELRRFRFSGSIDSVPEGTLVFPNEPLVRVEGRIMEAQLVETAILNMANYQTLIATKASRIRQAAGDDTLLEFGTRRAQEMDAAVWGARAAYVAGFHATSNMRAGLLFGIPAKGTHAHAWVQAHQSELEAFERYAEALPDGVTLLVDTYDTLGSGVPHAIEVARQLRAKGKELQGIRLDSGDLAILSKEARRMLDEAGFPGVRIVASNDLDEHIIMELKAQGAAIDTWGVGTQLITAADQPSLGGVYKLAAIDRGDGYEPVIKLSGNLDKVTNPGAKTISRLIDTKTGYALGDYMALREEAALEGEPLQRIDPAHPYVRTAVSVYRAEPLLQPVFRSGELVAKLPELEDIRCYHLAQLCLFRPQHLRKLHPEPYPVWFSQQLWQLKTEMIQRVQAVQGDKKNG